MKSAQLELRCRFILCLMAIGILFPLICGVNAHPKDAKVLTEADPVVTDREEGDSGHDVSYRKNIDLNDPETGKLKVFSITFERPKQYKFIPEETTLTPDPNHPLTKIEGLEGNTKIKAEAVLNMNSSSSSDSFPLLIEGPLAEPPGDTEGEGGEQKKEKHWASTIEDDGVRIVPADGEAGVTGDVVPSNKGDDGEKHYVSPKETEQFVILKAVVFPQASQGDFATLYEWSPAPAAGTDVQPVAGKPDHVKVRRDAAKKIPVAVKNIGPGGTERDLINVWIVWAEWEANAKQAPTLDEPPKLSLDDNWAIPEQIGIVWLATISPASLFTDTDVPALHGPANGAKLAKVPGNQNGVNAYWDVSRQVRTKIVNGNPR